MMGAAHGKVILVGEHSVVYGHPAISVPFSAGRVRCTLASSNQNRLTSDAFDGPLERVPSSLDPIRALIEALEKTLNTGPYHHVMETGIPIGAGLGASAAFAAAIVRAHYHAKGRMLDDGTLFSWIQYSERRAHENPSGIDALTVMHANAWFFTKASKQPLTAELGAHLVIADTGERTPTRDAVMHVASNKYDAQVEKSIAELGRIGQTAREAFEHSDVERVALLMRASMRHLSFLGLSTPRLDAFIDTATANGALAAKLTGGGMGGCMIAICASSYAAREVTQALKHAHQAQTWVTQI